MYSDVLKMFFQILLVGLTFFLSRYEESTESPLLVETVTPQHIAEVVARWTGIPVSKLTQGEKAEIPRWPGGRWGVREKVEGCHGLPWVTCLRGTLNGRILCFEMWNLV